MYKIGETKQIMNKIRNNFGHLYTMETGETVTVVNKGLQGLHKPSSKSALLQTEFQFSQTGGCLLQTLLEAKFYLP